ncbi:MAG TPA: hypothetical protein VGG71_08565 [Chitinophagaceae bacterium]|jgi:hypothetical protein
MIKIKFTCSGIIEYFEDGDLHKKGKKSKFKISFDGDDQTSSVAEVPSSEPEPAQYLALGASQSATAPEVEHISQNVLPPVKISVEDMKAFKKRIGKVRETLEAVGFVPDSKLGGTRDQLGLYFTHFSNLKNPTDATKEDYELFTNYVEYEIKDAQKLLREILGKIKTEEASNAASN